MSYYAGDAGDYYAGDYYAGDPGLFSSFGKFFGGVARGAGGMLGSALGLTRQGAPSVSLAVPDSIVRRSVGAGLYRSEKIYYDQPQLPPPPGGMALMAAPGMALCNIKGHHLNKSFYFTRGGGTSHYPRTLLPHPKGSTCVKIRRMNVANPRALRRALRRVGGFGKLVKRARRAVARASSAVGIRHAVRKGVARRR